MPPTNKTPAGHALRRSVVAGAAGVSKSRMVDALHALAASRTGNGARLSSSRTLGSRLLSSMADAQFESGDQHRSTHGATTPHPALGFATTTQTIQRAGALARATFATVCFPSSTSTCFSERASERACERVQGHRRGQVRPEGWRERHIFGGVPVARHRVATRTSSRL